MKRKTKEKPVRVRWARLKPNPNESVFLIWIGDTVAGVENTIDEAKSRVQVVNVALSRLVSARDRRMK